MEPGFDIVFDGRVFGDRGGGVDCAEFFVGGEGLDVFDSWVGLSGALLPIEGCVADDDLCDIGGCDIGDTYDCEGLEVAGDGAVGGVDIGGGVIGAGVEYLFRA